MWDTGDGVTLLIGADSLLLFWFSSSKKSLLPAVPRAWDLKFYDSYQGNYSAIFNPTFLALVLTEFLKQHAIKNPFICIGLGDTMIWEQCCWLAKEQPTCHDMKSPLRTLIWNYAHIGSRNDKTEHFFYLFGLTREVLFQYQLLALNIPFSCRTITAKNRALLYVPCTHSQGALSFDTLVSDQIQVVTNHCLAALEGHGYNNFFEASQPFYDFFVKEKDAVIASLGLFLLGKNYEFQ